MSASTSPENSRNSGFTLIEALAALAIVSTGVAAIGALANGSLRSGLHSERHLAAIETARKILTGLPARADLVDGTLSGVVDSHAWRIDSAPLEESGAPGAWEAQNIVLRVQAPAGGSLEIDTIRLRKRSAP